MEWRADQGAASSANSWPPSNAQRWLPTGHWSELLRMLAHFSSCLRSGVRPGTQEESTFWKSWGILKFLSVMAWRLASVNFSSNDFKFQILKSSQHLTNISPTFFEYQNPYPLQPFPNFYTEGNLENEEAKKRMKRGRRQRIWNADLISLFFLFWIEDFNGIRIDHDFINQIYSSRSTVVSFQNRKIHKF